MKHKIFELERWYDGNLHGCEELPNGFHVAFEWAHLDDEPEGHFEISIAKQGRDYLKPGNLVLVKDADVHFKAFALKTDQHGDATGTSTAPADGDPLVVAWDGQKFAFVFKVTRQYYESPCMHCAHRGFYSPNRAMLERSPWYCECTHDDVFTSTDNPNEVCPNFLDEKKTEHRAGMFKSILTLAKETYIDGNVESAGQMRDRLEKGIIK